MTIKYIVIFCVCQGRPTLHYIRARSEARLKNKKK